MLGTEYTTKLKPHSNPETPQHYKSENCDSELPYDPAIPLWVYTEKQQMCRLTYAVSTYNGIAFTLKNSDTCYNMNVPRRHDAK